MRALGIHTHQRRRGGSNIYVYISERVHFYHSLRAVAPDMHPAAHSTLETCSPELRAQILHVTAHMSRINCGADGDVVV